MREEEDEGRGTRLARSALENGDAFLSRGKAIFSPLAVYPGSSIISIRLVYGISRSSGTATPRIGALISPIGPMGHAPKHFSAKNS